MNKLNLLKAFDENIKSKFSYLPSRLPSMSVTHDQHMLLIDSGLHTDMFNILCCEGTQKRESVRAGIQHFREKNLPYAFWIGFEQDPIWLEEELGKLDLVSVEMEWAMICDLMKTEENIIQLSHFPVKQVTNLNILQDFIAVIQAILPPHEHAAIEMLYRHSVDILLNGKSPMALFVGYDHEKPISTSSVFFHSGLASIFDVIVLPEMRGQGIGKQMTQQAMKYAKEKGFDICVLTATNDARYLYEKIGFEVVKAMKVYNEREKINPKELS